MTTNEQSKHAWADLVFGLVITECPAGIALTGKRHSMTRNPITRLWIPFGIQSLQINLICSEGEDVGYFANTYEVKLNNDEVIAVLVEDGEVGNYVAHEVTISLPRETGKWEKIEEAGEICTYRHTSGMEFEEDWC